MVAVAQHPNITLYSYSEVERVTGYIGNFTVTIREKAKYVDHDDCTGCGLCETKCPEKVKSEFDLGLGIRPAIYKPFAQAVPNKPVIDAANCRKLINGKCGVCEKICPVKAIRYDDQDRVFQEEVGAIVMATGYDLFPWEEAYGEYGYGRYPDVISGLHFERMVNASGPTGGKIKRPSDGKIPQDVAFIKCVGSRDDTKGKSYCSRTCCMYTAKHASQVMEKIPDGQAYVFYMDVRTAGKGYEEFYLRSVDQGAQYIRGRVSKIYPRGDRLVIKSEDTLLGKPIEVEVDLVVLATAMVPSAGSAEIAKIVGFSVDKDGFYQEAHPKLQPMETFTAGVFLAGACQGPRDIPDTVAQASGAAVKVAALLNKSELATEPMVANVDQSKCTGCEFCVPVCPYQAISMIPKKERAHGQVVERQVAHINKGLCQGCGACVAACRPCALDLDGYTGDQIVAEVDALCL